MCSSLLVVINILPWEGVGQARIHFIRGGGVIIASF
jgi:hypothetical protein